MNIVSMEWLSPVIAASAAHVAFRLAYFFYIGFTLRSAHSDQNKRRANTYEEWLRFKNKASFIINGDALLLALIILLSIGSLPPLIQYGHTMIVGLALACVGITVKLEAYRLVGEKGYYWYNFFCSVEEREYTPRGIYRYLDNPMYGVGYLHAFGLALIFRSVWGIIFALFDWGVIWAFYFFFERSHTLRNRNSARREGCS